ncbi:hypothetical protein ACLK19_01400 [Escherichia coli]
MTCCSNVSWIGRLNADFDVDFCMEKRDQVIEHVADMYGRDAASHGYHLRYNGGESGDRDVGRRWGIRTALLDCISKLIPPIWG